MRDEQTIIITEQYKELTQKVLFIMNEMKYEKGGDYIIFDNSFGRFTVDDIIEEICNLSNIGAEVVINTSMNNSDLFFPKHGHDYLKFSNQIPLN